MSVVKHNNINQGLSPGYGLSLEEREGFETLQLQYLVTDCRDCIVGYVSTASRWWVGRSQATDKSGQARD